VDLLVTFSPDADWSLLDHVTMETELSDRVAFLADAPKPRS
jgi:predicted nucleotidyltransferase